MTRVALALTVVTTLLIVPRTAICESATASAAGGPLSIIHEPAALTGAPRAPQEKSKEFLQSNLMRRTTFQDCSHCPVMKNIPTGKLWMGTTWSETSLEEIPHPIDTWEKPRHLVTVDTPFAMGEYLVTRGQFAYFVATTHFTGGGKGCAVWRNGSFQYDETNSWSNPGFNQTDEDPAVCISWDDAQAYVKWLTVVTKHVYLLPSEAEWEYAARADTTTSRWWGNDTDSICKYANGADLTAKAMFPTWDTATCYDGYVYTSPVGAFPPNGFGLHDMLGNALEWVDDCWTGDYRNAPMDAATPRTKDGDCKRHILRGGSWYNLPQYLRAGFRNGPVLAGRRLNTFGFRVIRASWGP